MRNPKRIAKVARKTKETKITVEMNLDGSGKSFVSTGIPFMDHMLELFAKHGIFDLKVSAVGDLQVDCHHTIEDLGLVLGDAIAKAAGEKKGIREQRIRLSQLAPHLSVLWGADGKLS